MTIIFRLCSFIAKIIKNKNIIHNIMASLIELKPNRLLLDSNFDGYKLSLREIPLKKRSFKNKIDRVLLNSNQYSILHAKVFGFHNHLVGDEFAKTGSVYFVDEDWNVNKIYVDLLCDELSDPVKVWQVPKLRERITGDYNVSMKFVSLDTVVICDGTGFLYILNTGCRDNDDRFTVSFSEEVAGPNETFVLIDAVFNQQKANSELHVLLLSIKQENPNEPYGSFLHWITLKFENEIWSQIALKQLRTKGIVQYGALEKGGEAVYIASDNECKITLNSDIPILKDNEKSTEELKYLYEWSQTIEDISININLPNNASKQLIHIISEPTKLVIKYDNEDLVCGFLHQRIDPDITTWSVEQNKLVVSLNKQETGLIWPELIVGDNTGKYILDSCIVEQVNEKLAHLTSEGEEMMTQTGTTFNSQQVEECDFENDKITTFERISGMSNQTTHKINLGSHQILMIAKLHTDLPPAIGVRYDVDICLWQPDGANNDFTVTHEGTLLALGYVQASKQNRKFLVCPPNMEYSAICESSGHIFIYRQKRPISSSELRHRATGRIQNIAEQQVLNITNDEILGIQAFDNQLFLLCENYIMSLKL